MMYQELFWLWTDAISDHFSDEFWQSNEDWILRAPLCDEWINKMFRRGNSAKDSAAIIERAHRIYLKAATT